MPTQLLTYAEQKKLAKNTLGYRSRRDLTRAALAAMLGCSAQTVLNIEHGKIHPESRYGRAMTALLTADEEAELLAQPAEVEAPEAETEPEVTEVTEEALDLMSQWEKKKGRTEAGAPVRFFNAIVQDTPNKKSIHGTLDLSTITELRIGTYQRELLLKRMNGYAKDYKDGAVVDELTLGMRGDRYEVNGDGSVTCYDPVFVIDGQQRAGGGIAAMIADETCEPFLTARIFIGTDSAWEQNQFKIRNRKREPVSANVHIRNLREEGNRFALLLYDLSFDPAFALCNRVTWNNGAKRGEVISAIGVLKVCSELFSRFAVGLINTKHEVMADKLNAVALKLGFDVTRNIIIDYWDVIDRTRGIRNIGFDGPYTQAKQPFNRGVAQCFAQHREFWKGNVLKVPRIYRERIININFDDPVIAPLIHGAIAGPNIFALAEWLRRWFNRGRPRANHLHRFDEE